MAEKIGHYVLPGSVVPRDPEAYFMTETDAVVEHKGEGIGKPIRKREWKLEKLWHEGG